MSIQKIKKEATNTRNRDMLVVVIPFLVATIIVIFNLVDTDLLDRLASAYMIAALISVAFLALLVWIGGKKK